MRYSGFLGVVEEIEVRPGIWEDRITEREVLGTMRTRTETHAVEGEIHPKLSSTRSVSVGALGIGPRDNSSIKYVTYAGKRWTLSSIVDEPPDIRLYFGEEYHGPVPD